MSKRGTENQLTKDEYDRDGDNDEGSSIQGVFKQASQEEMAKRVIKAPRARKLNGGADNGVAKPSPFANMSSFAAPSTSTATASPFASVSFAAPSTLTPTTGAAATAKPFSTGSFNFGVTPSSTSTPTPTAPSSTSTGLFNFGVTPSSTLTSTPAPKAPSTAGGLFNFGITPASTPMPSTSIATSSPLFTSSTSKASPLFSATSAPSSSLFSTTTTSFPSAAKPASTLTPGAFTFNVGSTPLAASSSTDTNKSETPDREELERYLQALNRTFVKKIEKELVNNPIVNLAQIFGQYTDKRQAIKKKYMTSTDAKSTTSSPALGSASLQNGSLSTGTSGATTSGSDAAPKLSFGVPLSAIGENPAPKPAFGGFNFGVSTATTTSTTTTDSKASTTPAATTSSPFAFSVPKPATSTAGATTSSSPFSLSASKPFGGFGTAPSPFSTSSPSAAPTAGGGFQFSVPASHPSDKKDEGDNEKMPDDTKSQLVDSRAGEEGEETVFEVKGKLYAVVDGENKDLGVGQFRVNENTESKKRRMIMRTGGTGQLILNNWVIQGMGPKRTKNFVTIFAVEDGKPKKFLLKVKEESSAEDVVRELEAGQGK
ncbi:hypothetical protein K457DRAFT_132766 [Linnemannia elongata AG-77]|uniref:RanBD1 domain-containing protein n=1 Tax=Linnemannia elongata AG-77 TaxID=1314771 RepID=A0A197KGL3_9FUNG|nr:hypothetical protein K457DRAFT_132766 [Linnemannia elongata AG-77]